MYPKYDACYTFLDEDNLVIYPVKNKKIGMVLATSDDRKKNIGFALQHGLLGCGKEKTDKQLSGSVATV